MANFLDLTTGLPALWVKIKSKFYTKAEVDAAIPSASSASPEMDGDAAVGVSTAYARADHIHPSDTSRVATNAPGANDSEAYLISQGYTDEDPLRIGYQTNSGLQRGVRIGHNYMNIVGLDSPTNDNDAATKKYVDDNIPAPEVFMVNISYDSVNQCHVADKTYTETGNAWSAGKIVYAKDSNGHSCIYDGECFKGIYHDEDFARRIEYFYNNNSNYELDYAEPSIVTQQWIDSYYLNKYNTTSYTPTADYNPATKKYVDEHGGNTYALSMNNNVITLTGSDSSTSSATLPVFGGTSADVWEGGVY